MAKKKKTPKDLHELQLLRPLLETYLKEIRALSSKKQDAALNKTKIGMINKVLNRIKDLLKDEPTSDFLEILDEEIIPSNSDALLVLAQFDSSIKQYRNAYFTHNHITGDLEIK